MSDTLAGAIVKAGESASPLKLRRVFISYALSLLGAVALAYVSAALFPLQTRVSLTDYFFRVQDAPVVTAIAAFLVVCAFLPTRTNSFIAGSSAGERLAPFLLAAFVFLCGVIGSSLVFQNFHLSRDEVLAEFDAQILRSGHLIAPIAPAWRAFAPALAPRFMQPIADNLGFVSQYLPGNAVLRAITGTMGDADLTGPLLSVLAVVAIYGIARQLWPQRKDVAVLAALLVATSSQILVTSMTSYAMCAHLAFNLLWLWLFLRDNKASHAGAMLTGALACGLHQVVFHPLFVAPFIVSLWRKNRRALAATYICVYALICLFWISYPQIALHVSGMTPQASDGAGLADFVSRAEFQLVYGEYNSVTMMLMNILRFIAWQNPIVIPLALLAYWPIRNGTGIARELAIGIVLTLCAMAIIIPYQGHGWGYRYMHGLIGSVALLAAYGWIDLTSRLETAQTAAARKVVVLASAFAAVVIFPVQALWAHNFAAPYARASAAITRAPTDIVIVDQTNLRAGEDLVQNDPLLRNKPKIMDLTNIDEASLAALCQRYRISIFDVSQGRPFGIGPIADRLGDGHEQRAKLRTILAKMSCGTPLNLPRE